VGNQVDNHGSSDSGGGILVINSDEGAMRAVLDGNSVWDVGQCGCGASPGIGVEGGGAGGVTIADVVGNTIDHAQVVGLFVDVDDNGPGPQRLLTVHAFDNVVTHAVEPLAINDVTPSRIGFDAGTSDYFADGTSGLSGHSSGTGNLAVDPRYYDAPFGNLRLKATSPLIDRGLVCSPGGIENLDAAGHGRLSGDGVDLGAFELGAEPPTGVALVGTSAANTLSGTAGDDILCGMGGGDTLKGGAGDDWIDGGTGADRVAGGTGADRIFGGAGSDPCLNAADGHGGDSIDGGTGTDHYRSDQGDTVTHAEVRSSCTV
jgi:Ca2+-binding RTX toxin-like protein